jgi:hypothetical protein
MVEPFPGEYLTREHVRVRLREVGPEEVPGPACDVVGKIEPDVRAPDQRNIGRCPDRREHPGGLRVVEDHDVARPQHLHQRRGVGGAAAVVSAAFRLAQGTPVARHAMQPVVEALRETKELRVALDDHPAAVDSRSPDVADQRAQHLGDAAPDGCRVDVPDRARAEQITPSVE